MWNPTAQWNEISKTATEYATNLSEIVAPTVDDEEYEKEEREMDAMLKSLRNIVGESHHDTDDIDQEEGDEVQSKWKDLIRLVARAEQRSFVTSPSTHKIHESSSSDSLQSQLNIQVAKNKELSDALNTLNSSKDDDTAKLRNQVEKLTLQVSQYEEALAAQEELLGDTPHSNEDQLIHNYQAQVKTLKADARIREADVARLELEVDNLTNALSEFETLREDEIKSLKSITSLEIQRLNDCVQALQVELDASSQQVEKKTRECLELQGQVIEERTRESEKLATPLHRSESKEEELMISQLFVKYMESKEEQVLAILANILDLTTEERIKIGLLEDTTSSDNIEGKTFTDAWTEFLNSQVE